MNATLLDSLFARFGFRYRLFLVRIFFPDTVGKYGGVRSTGGKLWFTDREQALSWLVANPLLTDCKEWAGFNLAQHGVKEEPVYRSFFREKSKKTPEMQIHEMQDYFASL